MSHDCYVISAINMATTLELLVWGANGHGQLGLGHCQENQSTVPTLCPTRNIDLSKIAFITAGGAHTMVILDDGKLLACGRNNKGQLGIFSETKNDVLEFTPVNIFFPVIKVACGWDHTIAITTDGALYAWGCNTYGQLGFPLSQKTILTPEKINGFKEKVIKISAGLRHSAAVTDDGKLWTWGCNKKCQLGVHTNIDKQILNKGDIHEVTALNGQKIIDVVCGAFHTAVLTDKNEVFLWGENKYGQINCDKLIPLIHIPRKLFQDCHSTEKIMKICSGWSHFVILTEKKVIWSWGRNDYGQLGRKTAEKYDYLPQPVTEAAKYKEICVGSEHNILINETITGDSLMSWGWNEHGICGTGNEENVYEPLSVSIPYREWTVKAVGCGAGHTLMLISHKS